MGMNVLQLRATFLFSLQIVNQTSTQYHQTMTTLVQSSNRPITTAPEDEESSAPSVDKAFLLARKNLIFFAVGFSSGLITGAILLYMFKRCRNRRSSETPGCK